MWQIFSFLFHLLHQQIFPNFCFFEVFLDQKYHPKSYTSLDVCSQQWKSNCIVFANFMAQKPMGKRENVSKKKIFFQEMSLKRDILANFLPQKFMTKYGIASTYFVTFVSQKTLVCLQCVVVE